ncbi:hypothetical protein M0802_006680 [Mischocyttarus mexicanus]|nr:hypothetical protein M0802_006680 [Mischocyttarus mexicanus]
MHIWIQCNYGYSAIMDMDMDNSIGYQDKVHLIVCVVEYISNKTYSFHDITEAYNLTLTFALCKAQQDHL